MKTMFFSKHMLWPCAVEDFTAVRSIGVDVRGCYAVMSNPLSRARGCVLLSCGTLATGHQQLGWIYLACTGHGHQIAGIFGVASPTGLGPH